MVSERGLEGRGPSRPLRRRAPGPTRRRAEASDGDSDTPEELFQVLAVVAALVPSFRTAALQTPSQMENGSNRREHTRFVLQTEI